jgi:hypothetical protein
MRTQSKAKIDGASDRAELNDKGSVGTQFWLC